MEAVRYCVDEPVANSEIPSDIVGLGDRGLTIDRETFASFTKSAPFNVPSVRSLYRAMGMAKARTQQKKQASGRVVAPSSAHWPEEEQAQRSELEPGRDWDWPRTLSAAEIRLSSSLKRCSASRYRIRSQQQFG
jgi:hypothetical protein